VARDVERPVAGPFSAFEEIQIKVWAGNCLSNRRGVVLDATTMGRDD
jgi:hypothetical protein